MKRTLLLVVLIASVPGPSWATLLTGGSTTRVVTMTDCVTGITCDAKSPEFCQQPTALYMCNTSLGSYVVVTAGAGGGAPGGSNTQFQYNNGGVFGGAAQFTYDSASGAASFGKMPFFHTTSGVGTATFQATSPDVVSLIFDQDALNGSYGIWDETIDFGDKRSLSFHHSWPANPPDGQDVMFWTHEAHPKMGFGAMGIPTATFDFLDYSATDRITMLVRPNSGHSLTTPTIQVNDRNGSGTLSGALNVWPDGARGVTLGSSDATTRVFNDNSGNRAISLGTAGTVGSNVHQALTNNNAGTKHSELRFNLDGSIGFYADYTHRTDGTDLTSTLLQRFGIGTSGVISLIPDGTNGATVGSTGVLSKTGTGTVQADTIVGSTTFPGTCAANASFYVKTDAVPAGQQLYLCNSAGNGWNLVGDGAAGGTTHNLLSSTHLDTTAAAVVRGDMIAGIGATPSWQRVAHGGTGTYPKWNGTDIVASTGAASGVGGCAANSWASTLNADAAPTCTGLAASVITDTKCANIDPTSTTSDWFFWRPEFNSTVTHVNCIVDVVTSVVMTLRKCDANGGSCTAVEAAMTCGTTNTTESGAIDSAALTAGTWTRILRGTVTGAATQATLCVTYTIP